MSPVRCHCIASLRLALLPSLIVFALALPMSAQSEDSSQPASSPNSQTPQSQRDMDHAHIGRDAAGSSTSPSAAKDKLFLRKAAMDGSAEVAFGKLAAQKGSTEDVRALGQHMVTDHSEINSSLKAAADAQGIMLPNKLSPEDQALSARLGALSGEEFDREYLKAMQDAHHRDLREFRVELSSTADPELHDAVRKGVILIHEHMTSVDRMARARGIEPPARQSSPSSDTSASLPPQP